MVRKGINCPNRQWERWTEQEVAALWDLQPESLLVLAYDTGIAAQQDQRRVVHEYVRAHPATRVLIRPYDDRIPTDEPTSWAEECARRLDWWGLAAECIPANEINLEIEGGHRDWKQHIRWLRTFAERWHQLSTAALHLPALSPQADGSHYDAWTLFHYAGLHQLFSMVDVHCYPGSLDDWRRAADFFQRPICVTEFNQVDPAAFLPGLDPRVTDGCWFILSGTEDQRTYWLLGSPYYESFKSGAAARPIASGGDTPMPTNTDEGKLGEYARWAQARIANHEDPRDTVAFVEHLRRLGADYRSPHDYGLPFVVVRPLSS